MAKSDPVYDIEPISDIEPDSKSEPWPKSHSLGMEECPAREAFDEPHIPVEPDIDVWIPLR